MEPDRTAAFLVLAAVLVGVVARWLWRSRRSWATPKVQFLNRGEQFEFDGPAGTFKGECAWTHEQPDGRLVVYVELLARKGIATPMSLDEQREVAMAVRDTLLRADSRYRIDLVEP